MKSETWNFSVSHSVFIIPYRSGFVHHDIHEKQEDLQWLLAVRELCKSGNTFAQVYVAGIVADAPFVNAVPSADGLERDTEFHGKLVLRHVGGAAEIAEILSDVQFHDGSLSL